MLLRLLLIGTLLTPLAIKAQELCSTNFKPVCGVTEIACFDNEPCPPLQRTYVNECYLNDAGANLLYNGVCSATEQCAALPDTSDCTGAIEIKLDDDNCETLVCHPDRTAGGAPSNCRMWFDGCNVCSRNLVAAELTCSKKTCDTKKPARCIDFFSPSAINPPNCQRWFDGCNTCWREMPNANADCTEKICDDQGEAYCLDYFADNTVTKKPTAPRNCKRWFDGCNTCFRHTPQAPLACTLMACEQSKKPRCLETFPKKIKQKIINKKQQNIKNKSRKTKQAEGNISTKIGFWGRVWARLKYIFSWFWATN